MALAMIEQSPPHIAIIDVNMPEMNGVELNRAIQERFPFIQTIMLSAYDDYDYVRECLKNGSIDYLLKHRLDGAAGCLVKQSSSGNTAKDRLEERKTHEAVAERLNPALIRDYIVYLVSGRKDATTEVKAFSQKQPVHPRVKLCGAAVQIVPFLLTESYSDVQTNRLVQQAVDMMRRAWGYSGADGGLRGGWAVCCRVRVQGAERTCHKERDRRTDEEASTCARAFP